MARNTTVERTESIQTTMPEAVSPQENLLTITEVARRLRVDPTTVRRWITNGVLEAVILPHQGKRLSYRVRQQTLDQLFVVPSPLIEHQNNT